MTELKVELWKTLQELNDDEFKDFKWFLNMDNFIEYYPGIPKAELEKAKRRDTVNLMVQTYREHGALKVTKKALKEMNRNDLVQRLEETCSGPKDHKTCSGGDQKEENTRKKPKLESVQQFAVEVTLDPDTAHPALFLSDDNTKVYCSDIYENLPENPKRFKKCVNVLGKQSFSSGRFYYEVQVKGKTAWTVGVAKESIERKGRITLSPEKGFWTIGLEDEDEYTANDENPVRLSVKKPPQKVGVFVDYEEGLVCFYDVDAADLLYAFTECSFTEELYPFFSPCTIDNGRNSAPLIIPPIKPPTNLKAHNPGKKKKQCQRKMADLESVQKFAVEVTLDHNTAHPNLILSDDGKQVHHGNERKKLPDNPERFYSCVNVLGKESFSSGRFYYEVQVKGKTKWDLGVAKESIKRKGSIATRPQNGYWTIMLRDEDEYIANDYDHPVRLSLKKPPQKVGVFVDYEEGLVCFYDVDAADLLYAFTKCSFTEELYPFFSPCTNDNGRNSAPLIISPVNLPPNLKTHDSGKEKKQCQRKMADLKSVQQFAVEVTLDPDTAHPALFLSEDRKRVHDGDVWEKLPNSRKRFNSCVNVLGKESFSSGRFYYEVQVKGKTEWDLGVAKESIKRKGSIATRPQNGYWTIMLRDEDEYIANDYDHPVRLSMKNPPQKVGVFVDYDEGLVCFYDVDAADLLYAFTECSFTEGLYPFFSPCTNDNGGNSAPLIISPVNLPPNLKTHDSGSEKKQCQRQMADLKSIQKFAVEVTLDHNTAHPNLILSDDGKQVHHGDERKKLPDNPERFHSCVNVLGKQSFSSESFYYEVQVKGKTAWTVGVAKESIKRKGQITLSPEKGFWTVWLRNGDKYSANDENPVRLSVKKPPQKVGVLVDYEEGLVCFYDVDAADLLYAFTECSFTEELYPFFSPCINDNGRNSAPLIISPVNHTD